MIKVAFLAAVLSPGLITSAAQELPAHQATATAMANLPCMKPTVPGHDWKQILGQKLEGWSLPKLATAREYADSLHTSSVMIVQCGPCGG